MFDSDKASSRSRLNSTKQRLKREFDVGPGFSWVTKGREVENYLDYDKVEESVRTVHPSASRLLVKGQWENLLKYKKVRSNSEKSANKVKIARHYVDTYDADLRVLDLDERVTQLCQFISKSNGNQN